MNRKSAPLRKEVVYAENTAGASEGGKQHIY